MEDEEYLELIEFLQEKMRSIGFEEYADDEAYYEENPETGEHFLPRPRDHLLAMLDAFTAVLKRNDRRFLETQVARINENLTDGQLKAVEIEMPTRRDGDSIGDSVDLSSLPNLEEIIEELYQLRGQLAETPSRGS